MKATERDAFERVLLDTVVPQNFEYKQKEEIYGKLIAESNKLLPHSLYRYRRCDEKSISAFYSDELWVTKPTLMNDGFDTRPYIDMTKIEDGIKRLVQPINERAFFNQDISNKGFPDVLVLIWQELMEMPSEELESKLKVTYNFLVNNMMIASNCIPNITQESIKIGCFSEELCSPYMWGQYADNESGFALEYNFSNEPYVEPTFQGNTRSSYIFPVVYGGNRYEVPTEYILYLITYSLLVQAIKSTGLNNIDSNLTMSLMSSVTCPDELVPTKIALHKSELWAQEREWRLFVSSSDAVFQSDDAGCCIKKATGVYLGRRISSINERILRVLASEKGIPVYKMQLEDTSPSYNLVVG